MCVFARVCVCMYVSVGCKWVYVCVCFVCVCQTCLGLEERQQQKDRGRHRQLCVKDRLHSSLSSLRQVVTPHRLASSLFLSSSVSVATQGEVNSGSLLVTVKPLPWVRRRLKRGENPHFLEHLSAINFPWWLLLKTKQEQSFGISVSLWQRSEEAAEGWAYWQLPSACRCFFSFCLFVFLFSNYILTLEGCLLLSISLACQ